MGPAGHTPDANSTPTSSLNQSRGAIEQSQYLSSQDEGLKSSVQQGAEETDTTSKSQSNGIFIVEPSPPRTLESSDDDAERSTEFFDDKYRQDSAVSSSANSVYVEKKELEEPPYHIFSFAKKRQLVYIVSLAGLFSPLSSNIYFPALKEISTVCTLLIITIEISV